MATFHLPRRLDLRDQCMKEAGISQIKTGGWSGGEVSMLIYLLVETCWISPIHFSAMPLLWQLVCKYLLTLTRTKQCHCTSPWFRLHGSAEYVCVRHWDIHGAVVCIPGSRLRVACESWCTDEFCWLWSAVNVLLRKRVSMSNTNTTERVKAIFS